jgi:type VI secretion system secreted protein Hcp
MAQDAFLKIDGIQGESTDDKHKDWMEITFYKWGAKQPTSASASTAGGGSSERATFGPLTVHKELDKASPKIALACADGTHVKEVILELCRAGGDKLKYMEFKLSNVIISSVEIVGATGIPTEAISFDYGKIEWTYTKQQRADGGGGGNVAAGWSLETNKKM